MNEKIKELIEEAEIGIFWNRDNPDYKWIEGTEEDLIKFAELIIKECVQICRDNIMDEETELTYNDGVIDCAVMVNFFRS